ncbi:MAG: HlyD family efflux transporter periplasmic adaptor subunit, partial [Pirellulaceae bacterium]
STGQCQRVALARALVGDPHVIQDGATSRQLYDNHRTTVNSLEAKLAAAKARADLLNAPARNDEVKMAEARVAAAEAQLDLAKVQLQKTELVAPISGQILQVNVKLGELTGPKLTTTPLVLADTRSFRVRAFVEEMDAPRARIGMAARISEDGLPGVVITGQIARLSLRMTGKQIWNDKPAERYDTKTREVWIDISQADGLVVGLRVDVVIDVAAS